MVAVADKAVINNKTQCIGKARRELKYYELSCQRSDC